MRSTGTPSCGGGRRVGVGAHLHRALQRADHGHVEVVERHRVARPRLDRLDRRGELLGAALHLEVHVDLEHRERRAACGSTPRRLRSFSTSSVPSRPSFESGAVAIVNHRLKSWLRR